MLTAAEYLGPVGIGVTGPCLMRGDDGKVYVVKFQNNRLGLKVLVNEFLACRFAEVVELCFPPGGVIEVTDKLIAKHRALRRLRVKAGKHFASLYMEHAVYLCRRNVRRAENTRQMAGVMLFDHLFHNADRTKNRKNLLLCREAERYRIYAIDHSHLFRRGRWDSRSLAYLTEVLRLNLRHPFGWLLKYYLTEADFDYYAAQIKSIQPETLRGFVDSVPAEWLSEAAEKTALLDFLQKRCLKIDLISGQLVRSIPNVHRRADADKPK